MSLRDLTNYPSETGLISGKCIKSELTPIFGSEVLNSKCEKACRKPDTEGVRTSIDYTVIGQERSQINGPAAYFHNPTPICRQFWKAGNYDSGQMFASQNRNGEAHMQVHPMFLHSNATSHKWVFGAVAELIDNAVDEVENGATFVMIDKITNPRDGSPALLVRDDGGGMDPESLKGCMSFGFSDKKKKSAIGQYGNGFKTSSMRLGADAIVFTRQLGDRTVSQSVGLLSYTFLRQTCHDKVVVPMVNYMLDLSTEIFGPILSHGQDHFSLNLSTILQWSPYSTEEMLIKQFDDIGPHGTKVVVYNLWLNNDGEMELDFDTDGEDIRVKTDPKLLHTSRCSNPVANKHIANLYRYSLRAYCSILYLKLPQNFQILLRGRIVEHHSIASGLKFIECIQYKPHAASKEASMITTIGFLKEAPHINIHGFNVYHKNRLILPFWNIGKASYGSGRGIVGVLEANFVQPTHDKQDFEKTSLFQKVEARLKQMTDEYWCHHCGLVGYEQVRKSPRAPKPSEHLMSAKVHTNLQPVILDQNVAYVQELYSKRKEHKPEVELEHTKKQRSSSPSSANSQLSGEKQQSVHGNEYRLQEEEITTLMQVNKRLQNQLSELEKNKEELNWKVQELNGELGQLESEYNRLLLDCKQWP